MRAFLLALLYPAMLLALYCAFIFAPREKEMGEVQRIFYFHLSAAWLCMLAFLILFVFSIVYLATGERKYDVWASSSAEIGVIFATLVLITGPLWAKPVWNTWWTWDPRLTTFLILWLIYVSYLLLRSNMAESDKKYKISAVFGIIGFIDVPIVFMSIRWWRTIHPVVITSSSMNLDPAMKTALFVALAAFTLFFVVLLDLRVRQQWQDYEISLKSVDL
ncbi:MAG: cytochrome c biogenesis protein CcsA [Acidobacteria bacterium]|nr:cytochrome c biogenesis protein CcsA [Acidobacteriota bacterium]